MNEYHLTALPASRDLSALQIRDWRPGRQYGPGDYVVVDGHPYACNTVHDSTMNDYPGKSANWTSCWTRCLWASSEYYIEADGAVTPYLTSADAAPIALPMAGGGGGGGGVDPDGNLSMTGNLNVGGIISVDGEGEVLGNFRVYQDLAVDGSAEITGTAYLLGNASIDGEVRMLNTVVILSSGLPTSDPAVIGQLWNDAGTLKVSAG